MAQSPIFAVTLACLAFYGVVEAAVTNTDPKYARFSPQLNIPYCVDPSYPSTEAGNFALGASIVQSGLPQVNGGPCVSFAKLASCPTTGYRLKFTPLVGTTTIAQPYSFTYPGNYTGVTEQVVAIVRPGDTYNLPCSTDPRCIARFMASALGLKNEHQRADRPISVIPDASLALPAAYTPNSNQSSGLYQTTNNYYDLCSITHNQPNDYGKGSAAFTLTSAAKPSTMPAPLQRLSYRDCVSLALMYQCYPPTTAAASILTTIQAACQADTCSAANGATTGSTGTGTGTGTGTPPTGTPPTGTPPTGTPPATGTTYICNGTSSTTLNASCSYPATAAANGSFIGFQYSCNGTVSATANATCNCNVPMVNQVYYCATVANTTTNSTNTTNPCASKMSDFCPPTTGIDEVGLLWNNNIYMFKGNCALPISVTNQVMGPPVPISTIMPVTSGANISNIATVWTPQVAPTVPPTAMITYVTTLAGSEYICTGTTPQCILYGPVTPPPVKNIKKFEYLDTSTAVPPVTTPYTFTMDSTLGSFFNDAPAGATPVLETTAQCASTAVPPAAGACTPVTTPTATNPVCDGPWLYANMADFKLGQRYVNVICTASMATPSKMAYMRVKFVGTGGASTAANWVYDPSPALQAMELGQAMQCPVPPPP